MRDKVLQITDKSGTAFKMLVSTPSAGTKAWQGLTEDFFGPAPDEGNWKARDKGFLKYNFGRTRSRLSNNGDATTRDVLILGYDGVKSYDGSDSFGMQLFEYEDWTGVNDKGEGFVIQPWVLSLTPGRILWEISLW